MDLAQTRGSANRSSSCPKFLEEFIPLFHVRVAQPHTFSTSCFFFQFPHAWSILEEVDCGRYMCGNTAEDFKIDPGFLSVSLTFKSSNSYRWQLFAIFDGQVRWKSISTARWLFTAEVVLLIWKTGYGSASGTRHIHTFELLLKSLYATFGRSSIIA